MQMAGGPWGAAENKWGRAHGSAEARMEHWLWLLAWGVLGSLSPSELHRAAPQAVVGAIVLTRHHFCILSVCSLMSSCL